ncbi:MAG: TatD DNase family protein [Alteromonadaceae bacterium]|jgi:TatD DNase family protein|tara:strand:- start:215 stop:1030 length:816 start_codon:yes stop_codon:yes gene_type:complete
MNFTDSHCHLDFDAFSNERPQLISQCASANIHQIIIPATHPANWQTVLNLASKENYHGCNLFACLGIHPWFLEGLTIAHLDDLARAVEQSTGPSIENKSKKIIAIGEAGIDGGIAKQQDNLNQQIMFFNYQLALAKQYQLPVIVHHRQSHHYIIPLLKKAKLTAGGVIHAFSGSYQQAKEYIDLGFKLGVGGTITYPRAKKTINTISRLPLSSLVLETDAPSMPLYGKQGKINSPLALIAVFETLVEIRKEEREIIAQQVEANVSQLFHLP